MIRLWTYAGTSLVFAVASLIGLCLYLTSLSLGQPLGLPWQLPASLGRLVAWVSVVGVGVAYVLAALVIAKGARLGGMLLLLGEVLLFALVMGQG
jgi:hypothetical protein